MVDNGCLNGLVAGIGANDLKTQSVALEGVRNILRHGVPHAGARGADGADGADGDASSERDKPKPDGDGGENQRPPNRFALLLEECGGLDLIERCQESESDEVRPAFPPLLLFDRILTQCSFLLDWLCRFTPSRTKFSW
jgi:hypothetical protein